MFYRLVSVILFVAIFVTLVPNDKFAPTTRHMVAVVIALIATFLLMGLSFGIVETIPSGRVFP